MAIECKRVNFAYVILSIWNGFETAHFSLETCLFTFFSNFFIYLDNILFVLKLIAMCSWIFAVSSSDSFLMSPPLWVLFKCQRWNPIDNSIFFFLYKERNSWQISWWNMRILSKYFREIVAVSPILLQPNGIEYQILT